MLGYNVHNYWKSLKVGELDPTQSGYKYRFDVTQDSRSRAHIERQNAEA